MLLGLSATVKTSYVLVYEKFQAFGICLFNELTRNITYTLENPGCFINCSSKLAYLRLLCPWTANCSFLCVPITLYSHHYYSTRTDFHIIICLHFMSSPLNLELLESRNLVFFKLNRPTPNSGEDPDYTWHMVVSCTNTDALKFITLDSSHGSS